MTLLMEFIMEKDTMNAIQMIQLQEQIMQDVIDFQLQEDIFKIHYAHMKYVKIEINSTEQLVHPCRAKEVEKEGTQEEYIAKIEQIIQDLGKNKLVSIGECGLDYDRFEYASKEEQLKQFPFHFDLAQKYNLPIYLHDRNTGGDFYKIVKENRHKFNKGVVHSFTGPESELQEILALDLYVGVNGCSLKTQENLQVLKKIPLDKIMLETDSPYCQIRNSHAGAKHIKTKFETTKKEKFKKGLMIRDRNEPCCIKQVSEVVAAELGVSEYDLAETAYKNTLSLYNLKEQ